MVKQTRSKAELQAWRDNLLKDAQQQVTEITTEAKFKQFLKVMAAFHSYSENNIKLINTQAPNATALAGYKKWQDLGRQVNKGAKSIRIMAPIIKKRSDITSDDEIKKLTDKQRQQKVITGYRFIPVFDISSTSGKTLTQATDFIEENLKGHTERAKSLYKPIKQAISKQTTYTISERAMEDERKGFINYKNEEIVINASSSPALKLKTLFHEYAHYQLREDDNLMRWSKFGQDWNSRGVIEAEAEAVAYASMQHLGIDTSDYSLGYIATWGKNPKFIDSAFSRIKHVVQNTIELTDNVVAAPQIQKAKQQIIQDSKSKQFEKSMNQSNNKAINTENPSKFKNPNKQMLR